MSAELTHMSLWWAAAQLVAPEGGWWSAGVEQEGNGGGTGPGVFHPPVG